MYAKSIFFTEGNHDDMNTVGLQTFLRVHAKIKYTFITHRVAEDWKPKSGPQEAHSEWKTSYGLWYSCYLRTPTAQIHWPILV
jgi:hypothetical protein